MVNSQAVKKNQSSMQVLKTLQLLLEGNYTMAQLIEHLNKKESEPIFNNSVVSKYINTCRYCGIEIHKIQNKYFVASMPFGLNLTSRDLYLFEKLQEIVKKTMGSRTNKIFQRLIANISKFCNKNIIRFEKKAEQEIYEIFNEAIENCKKVRLMFKAKYVMECIPLSITEKKHKVYFNIFYDGQEHSIVSTRISALEVLHEKFKPEDIGRTVIYKIKKDLIKRYELKEGEQILTQSLPDYMAISNYCVNKEKLLSRLMRYGELCEVTGTRDFREDMKKLIDDTLKNYGVEL